MKLRLLDNLPFASVRLAYRGVAQEIDVMLVDTGSASTVLSADRLAPLGVQPEPEDVLHMLRGVGV